MKEKCHVAQDAQMLESRYWVLILRVFVAFLGPSRDMQVSIRTQPLPSRVFPVHQTPYQSCHPTLHNLITESVVKKPTGDKHETYVSLSSAAFVTYDDV
jgi:hypothetical protein